ncbi:hypothetical protein EV356DRAFT_509667 [Viridothelium virens]|uniref:DASH complex subunit Hsk3 like-domain-containing protein n=1 Tax=Viridothelium virens TaxID=1048519 RepID=A0A6A6HIK9_VIRVR|nr:hypothetical protein EV356DRAFT_509667 [Viridothelium virens]
MSTNPPPRTPAARTTTAPRLSTVPPTTISTISSSQKPRQLSHLHAQLAQLTAHVADLENLLRMTAVQVESVRGLGGYAGGMFMAASKVLGEETVTGAGLGSNAMADSNSQKREERERSTGT